MISHYRAFINLGGLWKQNFGMCTGFQDPIYIANEMGYTGDNHLGLLEQRSYCLGDAKAANVLIDINDDAWIIDFGGGYTRGWVEKDHMETIPGDQEGLAKIKNFLYQGKSVYNPKDAPSFAR